MRVEYQKIVDIRLTGNPCALHRSPGATWQREESVIGGRTHESVNDSLPRSEGFGAEIEGFQLDGEVDAPTHRQLRQAFDDRGVLVFRGLDMDRAAQAYLSELVIRDRAPTLAEAAELARKQDGFWISNKEPGAAAPFGRLLFHKDMMWSPTRSSSTRSTG